MKYVAVYTAVYTVFLVVGWYSPGVPAVAVFGISHLCGLMGALSWRIIETTIETTRRTNDLLRRRCEAIARKD